MANKVKIEDIQRINIEKIKQEKKYETLFYVNFLDEFVGILSGSGAIGVFTDIIKSSLSLE